MGNRDILKTLVPDNFVNEQFGLPTVVDVLTELEKPGRDPRPEFKTAEFGAGIEEIKDLKTGMILEGVVTNVAAFGAFVDIGVHQDGLVHVSVLTDKFVKDPHQVIKVGQVVKVKVLEVDLARKRISLSMRLNESNNSSAVFTHERSGKTRINQNRAPTSQRESSTKNYALADALAKLKLR